MKYMGLNELREKYLSFFESKGHLRLESFPLIPKEDKSLLLINSGMAPLKKYFTGEITPPSKRVTTCQKCIRTPDIERVGKTARHGTYFEMLGNFSFGDYFKHEATAWAWEFVTQVMEIPEDRLWISIYEEDDETFDIWTKNVGVAPDRIVKLGKEDNFWEHGTGPCGPCSEIYFDRGLEHGCGSSDCAVGCECDRFVEFWNLVFTQFDSDGKGNYSRLANPNIDTGMGLERLACIMQGVNNLFEVDTVKNIMAHVSKIAGIDYGKDEKLDISLRVITDHIRSTVFMVADGVLLSNEGRGYVLRRLLRRAARHGKLIGISKPFLSEICDTVIKENHSAYPELTEKQQYIRKVILTEEERFAQTIDQGLSLLSDMIKALKQSGKATLSGDDAFKLYDTFGFPIDLTRDILSEQKIDIDEERFNSLMQEQRERARAAHFASGESAWRDNQDLTQDINSTEFLGYETTESESAVLGIISEDERQGVITEGHTAIILLDRTPFYAESGGQVGDIGIIKKGKSFFRVDDTKKTPDGKFLHYGTMISGEIRDTDRVHAAVDRTRRDAIRRNHSSLHLLQAALRKVLGAHVEQAGSYVDNERGRFDFTHFAPLTEEEIFMVENEVNQKILEGLNVAAREMPIAEAKIEGATALFGEKYSDIVRVIKMGDFSIELCGGTHVENTSKLGLFKILSESSVAAGVRRIESVTGKGVLDILNSKEMLIRKTANALKCNVSDIVMRAEQITDELKAAQRDIESMNARVSASKADELLKDAEDLDGIKFISAEIKNASVEVLRAMGDRIKDREAYAVAVLASVNGGKINFLAVCGSEAVKRGVNAGSLVKSVAVITDGGGGGRPDSAMAGGKNLSMLNTALASASELVKNMLK